MTAAGMEIRKAGQLAIGKGKEQAAVNVIVIMNDSLRRDHLGFYGNDWIQTPHLDRFAESAAVFDRAYIASYPTIPNRTDLFTGRYGFPHRGWQPLEPDDVILPEILQAHGYTSMLIFDTPPLVQDGFNFMRGFSGWDVFRGHHTDRWITDPTIPTPWPAPTYQIKTLRNMRGYLRNRAHWRYERDYIAPRTLSAAIDWLERNHSLDGFLLWVDTWDPHEPFDPPPADLALYADPGYTGPEIIYPEYGRATYMSAEEMKHVGALYAGEVTMVDRWVGRLLDKVEQLGLLKNTLIIHMTDHGHLHGEHDLEGKPGGLLGNLYEVTTRIPLMIRHPDGLGAGERISAIVQPPDILPTLLEFLGVPIPETVQGRSLWPLITGKSDRLRDSAFSGRFPRGLAPRSKRGHWDTAHTHDGWVGAADDVESLTVTDENWALVCGPRGRASELYDLCSDPAQTENVISDNVGTAQRIQKALVSFLEEFGASPRRVEPFQLTAEEMLQPPAEARQRLRLEAEFYVMFDARGQLIGFPSLKDAEEKLGPDMGGHALRATSFGWIRDEDPKALIHIFHQYYWAQDFA